MNKSAITLIVNCYCYWSHDHYDTGISLNAWFQAWAEQYPEANDFDYSLEYLRIRANKVRQAVEGGYSTSDVTSLKVLDTLVERVNGKATPAKKKSPVDTEFARIEKLTTAQQRALFERLAKKFR